LDGALADRCLPVPLRRKRKDEATKSYRMAVAEAEGIVLNQELDRWARGGPLLRRLEGTYATAEPLPLDNDRMADLLRPLQAVLTAGFGGPDGYPMKVLRTYAAGMEDRGSEVERQSKGVRLLAACREVFLGGPEKWGFIPTTELLARLHKMDEGPWKHYDHGRALGAEGLANLLRPYGIRPGRDGQTARGYYLADFADAWGRYLPPSP
jgi:hypothetical protein